MFLNSTVDVAVKPHFEIDRSRRAIRVDGDAVKLSSRAFDLLVALYDRRDRMVTKDELIDIVWPDVVVEENNLHVHISSLRRVFGRDALATIPGRGYQWTLVQEASERVESVMPRVTPLGMADDRDLDGHRKAFALREQLVGRDEDIARVSEMLISARWVTIVGTGGIGKTSLARAVIARLAQANGKTQEACWVDLAAIEQPQHIVATIAKAASVAIPDDRGSEEELFKNLSARSGIVVLDNCEHLKREIERWITLLLERAPALRILATSQEMFHHTQALTYRLDALALPARDASTEQIRVSAAVALLARRAQTENHRYRIDDSELPIAAELCRQLDGMPLAIEMAAVRLPALGVAGLNERLGDRIRLFRNKYPDAPVRQQSLRSALDWSVSLLSEDERTLFLFLTEFVGGFSLKAIPLLAPHVAHDDVEVLDALDSLVGKSLVHVVSTDPLRYRIAETARIYAREQLESSELREKSQHAHARVMTAIASQARSKLTEINDDPWLKSFFPDYENAELALAYGATHRDVETVAATAQFLISLDDVRSIVSPNMRERIRLAYEASKSATGLVRAKLMSVVATTPHIADPILPRKESARLAVEAWKDQGDGETLAYAWARYAYGCASTNDFETAREAVKAYEAIDSTRFSPRARLRIERLLASTSSYLGETSAHISRLQRALELTEEAVAKRRSAILLTEIGDALSIAERYDEAVLYGERSIAALKELGMNRGLRYAYSNAIAALCFSNSLERAIEYARASLAPEVAAQKFDIQGDPFALICALRTKHEFAAKFVGASDAWYEVAGYAREPMEKRMRERCVEICESAIGKDRFEKARSEGAALPVDKIYALAQEAFGN